MIFTNTRSYIPTAQYSGNTNKKNNKNQMMMYVRNVPPVIPQSHHVPGDVVIQTPRSYPDRVNERLDKNKIKWGEPFWNFFHVLAEKVKEDHFERVRKGLLNLIYVICTNLPCPDCTMHATQYLNGINFNNIKTRDELKDMLFHFHNAVNARKQYPLFLKDDLDPKYTKAILIPNIDRFFYFFRLKHHNVKLMSDDLYRERIAENISSWLKSNLDSFQR
jgi:hypothetical protein